MRYIINIGYILTILPQFAHLINPTAYLNYFLSPLAFSQTFSRSENLFPSSYVFLAPLPLRWDASDKSSWRVGNLTRLYPWPLPQSLAPIIQMSTKISSCCLLTWIIITMLYIIYHWDLNHSTCLDYPLFYC